MRYSRLTLFKSVAIALGALLLATGVSFGQAVSVSLPNVTGQVGSSQAIPVTVGDLTGKGVISFQFTVTFDTSIVKITNAIATGTLSAGMTTLVNTGTAGKITVAGSGTTALSGSGTLINLSADFAGKGTSALTFDSFVFNEGNPAATTTNGSAVVPTLAIALPSNLQVTAAVGATFTVPITTEDLTGKNVLSYEFVVSFDSTKVKLTGYNTTGTVSPSSMSVAANTNVSGRISIAAAGTANLAGSGTLINLTGQVVGSGISPLTFVSVKFNEGNPSVAGVNGAVTIGLNTKPTFTKKLPDTTIAENQALAYSYTATDPENNPVTFSGVGLPTGAAITSAGAFTWTPNYTQSGSYTITVVATDGALTDTAKATLTVTNVNRKPVIAFRSPTTISLVSRNVSQVFSVTASDPDGTALTYTWSVNNTVVSGATTSSYTYTSSDPHGTQKAVAVKVSDGGLDTSTTWNFSITPVEPGDPVPTEFALGQNYPNPFNPTTRISYDLPKEAPVTFEIYNVLGVKIRTLLSGDSKSAGQYTVVWDGKNDNGVSMPTGVYLYRINAGSFHASKKMTLLK